VGCIRSGYVMPRSQFRDVHMMRKILLLVITFVVWTAIDEGRQTNQNESHVPPLHNECLATPKYVSTGNGVGYVAIQNICANTISARVCANYSRKGWTCRLYAGVLPHAILKSTWTENVTGSVTEIKAWATDYASGSHATDYKNLPTVSEPSRTVLPR
jgi:hypothetical protein